MSTMNKIQTPKTYSMKKKKNQTNSSIPTTNGRYDSLEQVMKEYLSKVNIKKAEAIKKIKQNLNMYEQYAAKNHSDLGPHVHAFPTINLHDGYVAHIGIKWPQQSNPGFTVTKKFQLKNQTTDYFTIGKITPEDTKKSQIVFFLYPFLENFSCNTHQNEEVFFVYLTSSGFISERNGILKWLTEDGVAIGYKSDKYYVFHTFITDIKYNGEELTDKTKAKYEKLLWN